MAVTIVTRRRLALSPSLHLRLSLPLLLFSTIATVIVRPAAGTCQMLWPLQDRGPCGCDNLRISVYVLQCERRGLQAFPALPPNNGSDPSHVLVANFSGNSIAAIDGHFFRGGALPIITLDLSHNSVVELPAEALANIGTKLKSLNVSHNRLRRVQLDTLPPMLDLLDLSYNELSEPCSLPLAQLAHVRLRHNGVLALSSGCFAGTTAPELSRLQVLDLGGNAIDRLDPSAFKSVVASLKTLRLDGNKLGDGPLTALDPLGALSTLSLRANGMTSLDSLCVRKLSPALASLDLGDNRLDRVPPYCFKSYHGRTEELSLRVDGNRLIAVDENTFTGLELRLRVLDLSRNAIATVAVEAFDRVTELRSLDLSHNRLDSLAWLCAWKATKLEHLSIAGNRLRSLPVASSRCFSEKLSLLSLDLSGNRLLTIGNDQFAGLSRLSVLDLSNNDLTSVAVHAFDGLSSLRRLRLTSNALVYLRRCAFERVSGLVEFHYDANLLHCDCDLYWLKAYTAAISERGMREDAVSAPILHSSCATTSPDLVRRGAAAGGGSSVIDALNYCHSKLVAEQCLGLTVLAADVSSHNSSGAANVNLTWQLEPNFAASAASRPGAGMFYAESASVFSGSQLSLKGTLVDVSTGEEQVLGDWSVAYDGSRIERRLSAVAQLKADAGSGVYKACVLLSVTGGGSALRQSDCAVYPPDLQKPTVAPSSVVGPITDEGGLHPGAIAAIVLAVILALCIAATLVIIYFMYKKWHSYQPRKEDELAGREKNGSGGNWRNPVTSADGEPNEHSPMRTAEV